MKIIDFTNQTFGKWLVIKKNGKKKSSRDTLWECKCECGRIGNVTTSDLKHGRSTKCVYCHKHTRKYWNDSEIPKKVWDQILRNAKIRNIPVNITSQQAFDVFLKQNKKCSLTLLPLEFAKCATEFREAKHSASLDRIDSTRGYELDNIQWLHKDVNRMKMAFEQSYFIKLCKLVAVDHHGTMTM